MTGVVFYVIIRKKYMQKIEKNTCTDGTTQKMYGTGILRKWI